MTFNSAYRNLSGAVGQVGSTLGRVGMDLAGGGSSGAPWYSRLQAASFRGVPFGVIASDSSFGRRVAVHEYPYRDSVWVEDLGRAPRRISLVGFLVADSLVYGGGDVLTQRDRLQRACEAVGEGELVHPTLGRKSVALLRFRITERRDLGRVFEVAFQFVEAGKLEYPGGALSTLDSVLNAADDFGLAAVADFAKEIGEELKNGVAVVTQVVGTVGYYVRTVQRYINDATALYNAITDLPGAFGRFFSVSTTTRTSTSLTALKASTTASRASVSRSGTAALAAAAATSTATTTATGNAVAAHVTAAATAIPNPTDRLRILPTVAAADIGATSTAGKAVGALYRRAVIAEVARASAEYTPQSYDDAVATRDRVCDLLDAEIVRAGDAGADDTYAALRALRTAVATDLTERGASLARMVTVTTATPLPALVLAQRLYQDAGRSDELVSEANPVHPAFMPTRFSAKSA